MILQSEEKFKIHATERGYLGEEENLMEGGNITEEHLDKEPKSHT